LKYGNVGCQKLLDLNLLFFCSRTITNATTMKAQKLNVKAAEWKPPSARATPVTPVVTPSIAAQKTGPLVAAPSKPKWNVRFKKSVLI
jgi:hypothetical protein